MKKTAAVLAVIIFILTISGCAATVSVTAAGKQSPVETNTLPAPETSDIPGSKAVYTSYLSFSKAELERHKVVTAKTGNNKELDHVNRVISDLDGCVVSVMPITALGGEAPLSMLKGIGFSDIQVSLKDGIYTLDYTEPDGGTGNRYVNMIR